MVNIHPQIIEQCRRQLGDHFTLRVLTERDRTRHRHTLVNKNIDQVIAFHHASGISKSRKIDIAGSCTKRKQLWIKIVRRPRAVAAHEDTERDRFQWESVNPGNPGIASFPGCLFFNHNRCLLFIWR